MSKYNHKFALMKMSVLEYETDLDIDNEMEIEALDIAKRMAIADLNEYGAEDFLSQQPSTVAGSFASLCMDTSSNQLDEIINHKEIEGDLDELGVGDEQSRVDMSEVAVAVHNNFSKGMVVLSHYLLLFEHLKELYD